jgi:mxaC protein
MSAGFDFANPWALLLLPLALLPLLRSGRDTLEFSSLAWLPADRLGRIIGLLWRALAVVAIACVVLALAEPGRSETQVMRTGRGAEILILMDRSRSMDDRMLPSDWRKIDPLSRLAHTVRGQRKSKVARDLLSKFVTQRPDDRFSLMFFSKKPLDVVPFTQHDEVMQAGITAGGIGTGLAETEVGRALVAATSKFDDRAYSGSRIILLVSDGGARLDEVTQRRIRAGLSRNRIALYWFYLRGYNSPELGNNDPNRETSPEVSLHRFFQGLATPYHVYEAEVPEDLARAVSDVGRQQNFPLDFPERVPRVDFSRSFVGAAALACFLLLLYRLMLRRSWT